MTAVAHVASGAQLLSHVVFYGLLAVTLWRLCSLSHQSGTHGCSYLRAAVIGVTIAWATQALPTYWTAAVIVPAHVLSSFAGIGLGLAAAAFYMTTAGDADESGPPPTLTARMGIPRKHEVQRPPQVLVLMGSEGDETPVEIPWSGETIEPPPPLHLVA